MSYKSICCPCIAATLVLSLIMSMILVQQASAGSTLPRVPAPGILLADDTGHILYSQNPDQRFIPASTLKLMTSLAAIHYLGRDFRFKTEIFLTPLNQLLIKGYGDPLLTSESIERLSRQVAAALSDRHLDTVASILVDDTFFDPSITIPGTGSSSNPYEASPGACCANFNTVAFARNPVTGRYVSTEPQTPLLEFVESSISASGLSQGRIVLTGPQGRVYAGMLVRYFLGICGVTVKGDVKPGVKGPMDKVLTTFLSDQTLDGTIRKLLEFSNNFIANQILLTVGATVFSGPATLDKGVRALKNYAAGELGLRGLPLAEGSGISRDNRVSPREMLSILLAFKDYHNLMCHDDQEYYKTGTLYGVNTRAGYFQGLDNRLFPFVIMVNNAPGRGYGDIQKRLKAMIHFR
ncbi:MAG: D-alanyl-D-alanine carboxypeptidase [Pseudomonadota bacterium]